MKTILRSFRSQYIYKSFKSHVLKSTFLKIKNIIINK